MGLPVIIRGAREDELRLVYSAWIGTQKKSKLAKLMHPKVFAAGLHRLIERLLKRSGVIVAEYEGIVVGFIVFGDQSIHYVFVKEPYRRQGVARHLILPVVATRPDEVVRYTHAPEPWRNITPPSSWVYDPWAAWAPEE